MILMIIPQLCGISPFACFICPYMYTQLYTYPSTRAGYLYDYNRFRSTESIQGILNDKIYIIKLFHSHSHSHI